jgi:hypothetical protein
MMWPLCDDDGSQYDHKSWSQKWSQNMITNHDHKNDHKIEMITNHDHKIDHKKSVTNNHPPPAARRTNWRRLTTQSKKRHYLRCGAAWRDVIPCSEWRGFGDLVIICDLLWSLFLWSFFAWSLFFLWSFLWYFLWSFLWSFHFVIIFVIIEWSQIFVIIMCSWFSVTWAWCDKRDRSFSITLQSVTRNHVKKHAWLKINHVWLKSTFSSIFQGVARVLATVLW